VANCVLSVLNKENDDDDDDDDDMYRSVAWPIGQATDLYISSLIVVVVLIGYQKFN